MEPKTNYHRPSVIGLLCLVVLLGGSIAWASLANISGAVIASGVIGVEGQPKSIQHLDGGIIKKITTSTNEAVKKGDVLILLDDTKIAANFSIYKSRLAAALIRKERLIAELAQKNTFSIPTKIIKNLELGNIDDVFNQQKVLQTARRLTQKSRLSQLAEKIHQYNNQIQGAQETRKEKYNQIGTYQQEQKAIKTLVEKGLTPRTRLLAMVRAMADMRGQIAGHSSEISRLKNLIAETNIARLQVAQEFRERNIVELEKTDNQIGELKQQLFATRSQLDRIELRAPVSGVIHELNVFTIGGVIQSGQVLMQIVPKTVSHEVELRVDPLKIDNVFLGQSAVVHFSAFNQKITPQLYGNIIKISPASIVDDKTGQTYFKIKVRIKQKELMKLKGHKLIPGMPVEAMLQTNERTVLNYILKPLKDQMNRALREE